MEPEDCEDIENVTKEDLRKACEREMVEELGKNFEYGPLEFFDKVDFELYDETLMTKYFFVTKFLSGTPKIIEPDKFSKMEWIDVNDLNREDMCPDVKIISEKFKDFILD